MATAAHAEGYKFSTTDLRTHCCNKLPAAQICTIFVFVLGVFCECQTQCSLISTIAGSFFFAK